MLNTNSPDDRLGLYNKAYYSLSDFLQISTSAHVQGKTPLPNRCIAAKQKGCTNLQVTILNTPHDWINHVVQLFLHGDFIACKHVLLLELSLESNKCTRLPNST